jgi:Mitochondrial carrier protein
MHCCIDTSSCTAVLTRHLALLWIDEGLKGFYKGIIPTTAKAIVATAVTFAAYEVSRPTYICM